MSKFNQKKGSVHNMQLIDNQDSYQIVIDDEPHPSPIGRNGVVIIVPSFVFITIVIYIITHFAFCSNKIEPPTNPPHTIISIETLLATGFVFPDSDCRVLTENDLQALRTIQTSEHTEEELLRMAVNEIYARNGYRFKKDKYLYFYSKYDWYEGRLSAEGALANFNEIEKKNLKLLLKAENNKPFKAYDY